MNLFIPDPPYNVLPNDRDKFTAIYISNLCKYAVNFLDPKGTIIIFCSNMQYHIYVEELKKNNLIVESNGLYIIKDPSCN